MSGPIDIPFQASRGSARSLVRNTVFPADDGPYFGFIELFNDGQVLWAVSSGRDSYLPVGPFRQLPSLAFIVAKDHRAKSISIEITSLNLKKAVYRAILDQNPSISFQLDFAALLQHHDVLQLYCQRLDARNPNDNGLAEMRLLISDLLLDHGLYEGIGIAQYCRGRSPASRVTQTVSRGHLEAGLDDIAACFSCGLISQSLDEEHLDEANSRFVDMALTGNTDELQALLEPFTRSREMELLDCPDLLREALELGQHETYIYLLDLFDRTRDYSTDFRHIDELNVTFDPFYMAIRLGQFLTVQAYSRIGAYFEGRVKATGSESEQDKELMRCGGLVLDPLSAAVFWNRPSIVRLLLKLGPMYSAGFPQALALATASATGSSSCSVHQVLADYQTCHRSERRDFSTSHYAPCPLAQSSTPLQRPLVYQEAARACFWSMIESSLSFDTVENDSNMSAGASFHGMSVDYFGAVIPEMANMSSPPGWPTICGRSITIPRSDLIRHDTITQLKLAPSTKPYRSRLARRDSYAKRCIQGRKLVHRLSDQCALVRRFCSEQERSTTYLNLLTHFQSLENVWESGIAMFRTLVQGKQPVNIVVMLQGLVVADALAWATSESFPDFAAQFQEDLERWSLTLCGVERDLFEDIAFVLWRRDGPPRAWSGKESLFEEYKFRNLVSRFIFAPEDLGRRKQLEGDRGTNLRRLREHFPKQLCKLDNHRPQARASSGNDGGSIAGVLGQLTRDTDSSDSEDDFDLNDYIHLEALEEECDITSKTISIEVPAKSCETDIEPPIISLLGSVAFSSVLVWMSRARCSSYADVSAALETMQPNYTRSCLLLEKALGFAADGDEVSHMTEQYLEGVDDHISRMKSSVRQKSNSLTVASTPSTCNTSARSGTRASVSSPSASSFVSTDYTSTDADSTAATGSSRRLRCLSMQCPKTFSSVSNRNKHVREGCSFRDKKGYQCRNEGCKKVLTTKWYRNTHEEDRCRFR